MLSSPVTSQPDQRSSPALSLTRGQHKRLSKPWWLLPERAEEGLAVVAAEQEDETLQVIAQRGRPSL
jgi:hypothetical protein